MYQTFAYSCQVNELTDDSEEIMRRLLTQLPHLEIW